MWLRWISSVSHHRRTASRCSRTSCDSSPPRTDPQRSLQARALQLSDDIAEARALLVQQAGRGSLPMPFVVILVFWLIMIFASFGMFSTRNTTVIVSFLICALSVAGSLYLILEIDHPYQGLIKISSAPLKSALMQLGR